MESPGCFVWKVLSLIKLKIVIFLTDRVNATTITCGIKIKNEQSGTKKSNILLSNFPTSFLAREESREKGETILCVLNFNLISCIE